jgi:hypothetical protein
MSSAAPPGPDGGSPQRPLPRVHCDPIASLSPRAIDIEVLGRIVTVPPMTAEDWLRLLWADPLDMEQIFPGLAMDTWEVDEAVISGEMSFDEPLEIGLEILEVASGYRWWFLLRVIATAKAAWMQLGGMLIAAGIDAARISLGAWVSATMALWIEHMPPDKVAPLIDQLVAAPEGYEPEFDEEAESAAFLAAMSGPF